MSSYKVTYNGTTSECFAFGQEFLGLKIVSWWGINIFQCCMLVYKIITAFLVLQNCLPVAQKF